MKKQFKIIAEKLGKEAFKTQLERNAIHDPQLTKLINQLNSEIRYDDKLITAWNKGWDKEKNELELAVAEIA